jgi:hypothetical protein
MSKIYEAHHYSFPQHPITSPRLSPNVPLLSNTLICISPLQQDQVPHSIAVVPNYFGSRRTAKHIKMFWRISCTKLKKILTYFKL